MKEVKTPKKPLAIYYAIVLLVLMLLNFVLVPCEKNPVFAGAEILLGELAPEDMARIDLVVLSPGVPTPLMPRQKG